MLRFTDLEGASVHIIIYFVFELVYNYEFGSALFEKRLHYYCSTIQPAMLHVLMQ